MDNWKEDNRFNEGRSLRPVDETSPGSSQGWEEVKEARERRTGEGKRDMVQSPVK